jgi:hypothetical protein
MALHSQLYLSGRLASNPISCFAYSAEKVKTLARGAAITVGAHLYGTKFEGDQGTKYGVQLIADTVFRPEAAHE